MLRSTLASVLFSSLVSLRATLHGIKYGVEVMQNYFGEDLGWNASLKYMGLTDTVDPVEVELEEPEAAKLTEVGVKPVSVAA